MTPEQIEGFREQQQVLLQEFDKIAVNLGSNPILVPKDDSVKILLSINEHLFRIRSEMVRTRNRLGSIEVGLVILTSAVCGVIGILVAIKAGW